MKWAAVAAVLLVAAVADGADLAHRQQAVNRLLYRIYSPIPSKFGELKTLSSSFEPRAHTSHCNDGGNAVNHLMDEYEAGRLLKQHNWFSLFNTRQREEALMLVDVLLNCKDFETFVGNAAFFRENMNEGEFVYALYVAVTHSDVMQDVVLPPLYEVTPHMFTNSEVLDKAYAAKMTQTPGDFKMSFTGSKKNKEQRVAYFGEDIGMNSHHVHWHMDFPFWWHGDEIDRKGELFFWAHHQLTVRFDAERLSNYLPPVDELYWDRPIKEGFAPHTNYKYGGEFPTRPDNKNFEDVDGVARIRDMKEMESRIRDAIAHGYVDKVDGSHIDIDNDHGIDVVGAAIESSTSSVNPAYYGALHNQAHRVLGAQADPHGKFNMPPGVMEHFETATRDPSFFRLHKYMDNIFKEHKDKLPPYSAADLKYDNVEVTGVDVDELSTFFENFQFDLGNALDTTDNVNDVAVHAIIPRLNHKPFGYNIHYKADHAETVTVRVYLTPKYDNNGVRLPLEQNRWNSILLDTFWVNVEAGEHTYHRDAAQSNVAIPDRPAFEELMKKADEAVAGGSELSEDYGQSCGHPQRLLLPKGNEKGLECWFAVFVTSGDDATHDDLHSNDHGGNHGYCGIHGGKYPDKRPMGFPFDRRIPNPATLLEQPNFHSHTVRVYHKEE
ncbi:hemocyanin-like [Portunus trituberculatus]|uniref:Hemocyanin A chain n=1 Tax=Portunus trituberculatus TaxID=210409 RepID=A0A5B7DUJ6_PORTR|nr:hemocyanin-like [Portunus trituberculatus]MPC25128.1 Hemocyanin A chain [Portunus trituberculatus]